MPKSLRRPTAGGGGALWIVDAQPAHAHAEAQILAVTEAGFDGPPFGIELDDPRRGEGAVAGGGDSTSHSFRARPPLTQSAANRVSPHATSVSPNRYLHRPLIPRPAASPRRRPNCAAPSPRRSACAGASWPARFAARPYLRSPVKAPPAASTRRLARQRIVADGEFDRLQALISSRRRAASSNSRLAAASLMRFSRSAIVALKLWPMIAAPAASPAVDGDVILLVDRAENVLDAALDRGRRDAVRVIVGVLFVAAAVGFVHGALHRAGDTIGIEHHLAVDIARRAADGLHQRSFAAQKAFLVGVEDRDQRAFGNVRPSRNRLMPTSTSKAPRRRSRMISMRSIVSMSECM